ALNELALVEKKLSETEIILKERETYMRELKKDRDHALKYRELEKDIRSNKATNLHLQIKERETKRADLDSRLKNNNSELERISSKLKEIQSKIESRKAELDSITKDIEQKSEVESVSLQRRLDALKTEFIKNTERSNTAKNEINKLQERIKQLNSALNDTKNTINDLEKSKKELSSEILALEQEEKSVMEKLDKFKRNHNIFSATEFTKLDQDIDKNEQEYRKLLDQKQVLMQRKFLIESQINALQENLKKGHELERSTNIKQVNKDLEKHNSELQKLLNENSSIVIQLSNSRKEFSSKNDDLTKLQAKHLSIREMASLDISINKVLNSKINGVYGLVSQLGKVDPKYALALEVAAGARLKGIVVEDEGIASECIKLLKHNKFGTALFLPLNKIKSREEPNISNKDVHGRAIDLIEFNQKFKNVFSFVFGGTLVVENVETARRIGVGKVRMVTIEGDLFETSGAIIGGYRSRSRGLGFSEKGLEENVSKLEIELNDIKKLISVLENKRNENEGFIQDIRRKKAELESEAMKISKTADILDVENSEKQIEKLQKDRIYQDLEEIDKKIKNSLDELENLKKSRSKLRSSSKDLSNPNIANELQKLESRKQLTREKIVQLTTEIKNIELQVSNIYNPELEKTMQIIKQQEKELGEFRLEFKELEDKISKQSKDLKEEESKEQKFQKDYKGLFEKRNKVNEELQKLETNVTSENIKIKDIETKINDISISRAKIIAELEALQQEFEEFKGEPLRRNIPPEELKVEIKKFEHLMSSLGNVNLRALEIYENVEKEYKSILEKVDQLRQEKDSVLQMMQEIETKKKGSFMKTFKVVAENFRNIFVQLTAKGEAHLEIENKENPFEAGVDIKVKLGSGKYLDIRSLSGGEKTLTALALIFAIQEYQPASFYLLDEVDAALDKSNSDLLSKLIKKYSANAQYILISHNDALISEAEYIYGVAMQENGVSKVVSLKI
ncbi:hypothetical protein HYT58_02010, partial [Candidatus Woesearchaeota archaeon]|nr:hypothetical protein [Candidatus Woesearchaeota archaeon]